jgi:hypothetical protein
MPVIESPTQVGKLLNDPWQILGVVIKMLVYVRLRTDGFVRLTPVPETVIFRKSAIL